MASREVGQQPKPEICSVRNIERKLYGNEKLVSDTKLDRRVQKTRHLLQEALIALILEKGYDAVTVQDILDHANVGRSTFYAHYEDKDALLAARLATLQEMFESHLASVLDQSTGANHIGPGMPLYVLRYVKHEHRLFKALIGKRGSSKYAEQFQNFLLKYTREIITSFSHAALLPHQLEMIAVYLSSVFLATLIWWIDNDLPCSAEDVYSLLMQLIEPGLKGVLQVQSLWV
jgi:AcrR family transcriptional regulator